MKKRLFTIFLITTIILPFFGQAVDFKLEQPEVFITQNLGIPFVTDSKRDTISLSTTGYADFQQMTIKTGVQGTGGKADFSLMCVYWPKFFYHMNIGPGLLLHYYTNNTISTEFDFIPGLYMRYKGPILELFTQGGLFLKVSHIPSFISNSNVLDNSLLINLHFYWTVNQVTKVYFLVETSTFYDYFLFCTPIFTSGAEYTFLQKWAVGSNLSLTFLDMFTVSSHYSQISVNTYIKFKVY